MGAKRGQSCGPNAQTLNFSLVHTDVYRAVAEKLHLPTSGSRADSQQMIEGKLEYEGYQPRNVQVRITKEEDSEGAIP